MSRGLWFVAGAGAGVYAVVRGRRAVEVFTVDGLTDRLNGAALGLRLLRDEVGQGRVEKETELRGRLVAATQARAQLDIAPDTTTTHEEEDSS